MGPLANRKIIGCQGPTEKTYPDLWRMVAQENVTLIVTTCNTTEKGSRKCHRFWPNDSNQFEFSNDTDLNDTMRNYGIEVTSSGANQNLTDHLILRSITLTDHKLGISGRKIQQLHYTGWPDHGVPSASSLQSFKRMFEIFTYMLLASDQNEKAIVHCSAGIGRTGTTIALAHLIV